MNTYRRFKQKVFNIVEKHNSKSISAVIYNIFLSLLIVISCCLVIVELFDLPEQVHDILLIVEYVITGCFVVEYLVKLWLADLIYPELSPFRSRIEFIISFESFIDIIAILSILLNQIPKEFSIVKMLKLIKLLRITKMTEHIDSDKPHSKLDTFKKRLHELITKDTEGDKLSRLYDIFAVALICLSVVILFVETFALPDLVQSILHGIEYGIAIIFLLEYFVRIWLAPQEYPKLKPDKARMKYIFSFMALIDILSIVPVLVISLPDGAGVIKVFKLCKILRLVKASRYLSGVADFASAVSARKKQIGFSLVIMAFLLVLCSFLMFTFESGEQPEIYGNAFSGMKIAFSVLTGVGEESFEPQTLMGKVLSMVMSLLAVCVFAVPVSIVSDEFMNIVESKNTIVKEESEEVEEQEETTEQDNIDISALDEKGKALIRQVYQTLTDKEE